jgi:hypothetical protein
VVAGIERKTEHTAKTAASVLLLKKQNPRDPEAARVCEEENDQE